MTFKPNPKPPPRPKKKRKRIAPISESKKLDLKLYKQAREEYLSDTPFCERCQIRHELEIHHKAGRIGSLLFNKKYFMAVCRDCHIYIENNVTESKLKGWSINRTAL